MELADYIETEKGNGKIPEKICTIIQNFIPDYFQAVASLEEDGVDYKGRFKEFFQIAIRQIYKPFAFTPYHRAIREPFDYVSFSRDFIRPLIVLKESKILGLDHVAEIDKIISAGENVVFLANHQTEPDAHIIPLLLENEPYPFAQEMIFVAGHRVTTDPLAIPFSMGTNLLCIYSKRHIKNPPEMKEKKLAHNKSVMSKMRELLDEGGKCIYVAPSGGRDRPDENGAVQAAPFDPQSVEMFRLMAKKAKKTTRFFPLALWTYPLMPPPNTIEEELLEKRQMQRVPVHLAFGEQLNMTHYPEHGNPDKSVRRRALATYAWSEVKKLYQQLDTGD